jgi:hypothetical protein
LCQISPGRRKKFLDTIVTRECAIPTNYHANYKFRRDGKLVGIVGRANLLQAIATIGKTIKPAVTVDGATLREKVISQLDRQPIAWRSLISVIVHDEMWRAVRVAAEVTPGVRAVADNLIVSPIRYGYQLGPPHGTLRAESVPRG